MTPETSPARLGEEQANRAYAEGMTLSVDQGSQPVIAAGGDLQVPAVGGQLARERFSDSGGCSGHKGQHGPPIVRGCWTDGRWRLSAWDEPPGLAGLGVAGDVGDLADMHLGSGRPAVRRLCSSEAASAAWSRCPPATTATSIPRLVWRTWYSSAAGVRTITVRITSGSIAILP